MMTPDFQRHIDDCNNAILPGDRTALFIGDAQIGWAEPQIAQALQSRREVSPIAAGLQLRHPASLPGFAQSLAGEGLYRFRNEAFDVRAEPNGPTLATIDRGALPAFGIMAEGVHLNGLVQRPDGLHIWIARRAANKPLDPGKLDHIVAGGVSAGMTAWETLLKEAAEEAAIPEGLAAQSKHVGQITYTMMREEGLRRDVLQCYDLMLPESFIPTAADGEVESFELWPIERAYETVRATDDFKFNVNLVLIDLFRRQNMLA
eukprot:gene11496-11592_t